LGEGGGLENERQRRNVVGGLGAFSPGKILKFRGSETAFSAFSTGYFFKKN